MTWEIFKAAKEEKNIKCPFCDKGEIKAIYTPQIKMEKMARGSAVSKRSTQFTKEKYHVLNDCSNCSVSSGKIEKALNSGEDYRKPSRESVLKRMRKAGLPTRI